MSGRAGRIFRRDSLAGIVEEVAGGYRFTYDRDYLRGSALPAISLTLPKRSEPYDAPVLFPCLVALLAEGALAEVQCRQLRLDERDLFGRLLKTCASDVIGSLRIEEVVP